MVPPRLHPVTLDSTVVFRFRDSETRRGTPSSRLLDKRERPINIGLRSMCTIPVCSLVFPVTPLVGPDVPVVHPLDWCRPPEYRPCPIPVHSDPGGHASCYGPSRYGGPVMVLRSDRRCRPQVLRATDGCRPQVLRETWFSVVRRNVIKPKTQTNKTPKQNQTKPKKPLYRNETTDPVDFTSPC